MAKTKMWKFKQIKPQKARGKMRDEYLTAFDWVAEEKYDGDRRVAQFCGEVVRFTGSREGVNGRMVEKTENVPHLSQLPSELGLRLEGTVLDGEMIVPRGFVCGAGGRSKHVTSIMGSAPDVALLKQKERGWLRYAVFDCLYYRGQDIRKLTYEQRRSFAGRALEAWHNRHAFLVPSVRGEKRGFLEDIWATGGEGIVLKRTDHLYGDEKGWVKVKDTLCADVVIVGYKDPTTISKKVNGEVSPTKYAERGLIGAVVFGQFRGGHLVPCGTTSGMDDETREQLTKHQRKYLGAVIEIKANGREPTGAFRHPQFKRFRPDKNPKDCKFNLNET